MTTSEQKPGAPACVEIPAAHEPLSLRFEIDPQYPGMVEVTATYKFPSDHGTLTAPQVIEGVEVEDLYRLLRVAMQARVAEAEAEWQDRLDELLPRVQEIDAREVPPPVLDPLILEHTGRRKVVDIRAGDRQHWVYVSSVVVHSTECVKVRKKITDRGQPTPGRLGRAMFSLERDALNGRTAKWPEILPQVREGNLHVTMCRTCKPLGQYGDTVNARTSFNVATKPPEQMPWAFPGFYKQDPLSVWQRESVWRAVMAMTPQRWHALADLIAWAALEVDPDAFATPLMDDSEMMVSQ